MKYTQARKSRIFAAFAPLKILLTYIAATLSLAIWGPVEYYLFPIGQTVIFVAAAMLSIAIGYCLGINSGRIGPAHRNQFGSDALVRQLFDVSLGISLFAFALSLVSAGVSGQINTDLSDIGGAYMTGYEKYERNTGSYSLVFIIYSLSLPFNFIAMILGFYYFFSINFTRKSIVIFIAVGSLLFYVVGSGKQKQLGDILIYFLTVFLIKYAVRRKPIQFKWIAGSVILGISVTLIFAAVLGQRYSAIGVDVGNINAKVSDHVLFNTNHPIFSVLGEDLGLNVSIFLSYLSQGYYGLGLALNTNWDWTHFLGFSYSVSILASRLFGLDWEWPNTLLYQVGVNTGWGESKWHTVFVHFATDFTFSGTIILFGYFSYIFARAWLSAIKYENPFAILMFAMLALGACFIPANNQLLHSPGGLFTVIVISILYMWLGRRYNRPQRMSLFTSMPRMRARHWP